LREFAKSFVILGTHLSGQKERHPMKLRSMLQISALLCAVAVALLIPPGAWAEQGGLRCEELSFPVTLSAGDATVYNVFGILCSRASIENKTVQITLHGATYSHL